VFKDTYKVPFPIFPDEDFRIHKALGEVRTPFFIAIKTERDGSHKIVHTYLGGFTNAKAFLDLMAEAYGIKQEDLLIKKRPLHPWSLYPNDPFKKYLVKGEKPSRLVRY